MTSYGKKRNNELEGQNSRTWQQRAISSYKVYIMHWKMIQDVKSSPFILSAIPRIICNKCTLWTEEDALQNSFLCILSEYSLTKKENTSCFEPMPMRQLYIFGISIMEWVNQAIDDKNKWLLIQGKNACCIFSDVMRVWDLIFFFF